MPKTLPALLVATLLILGGELATSATAHADELDRLSGPDRYETALAASRASREASDHVVIATAAEFPDALAAASLATREGSPLLLVPDAGLPEPVAAEIERLGAQRITIVGGTSAVPADTVAALGALPGVDDVQRLAGHTRYTTAGTVAAAGGSAGEAVLVSGEAFPDAVTATSLAGDPSAPILLTEPEALTGSTARTLSQLDVERVTIVGGTRAVAGSVAAEVEGLVDEVERIAGVTRYGTSTAVADAALSRRDVEASTPVLASGTSFADAVVAGVHASETDGILLLASPRQPEDTLDSFLRAEADRWRDPVIVGGSLPHRAADAIGRAARDEPHPEPEPEPEPTVGELVVEAAREQLGTPYQWGGNGPHGFDCSGLTRWAWDAVGVTLPRVSTEQFARLPRVPAGQEQPGDIVAFGTPVHHVGIYIGDGQMIDAPRRGTTVQVRDLLRSDLRGFVRPGG